MSWQNCTLGDVVKLQRGHDLPERLRVDGPIPIVSSSGITGRHNVAKAQPPGVVTGRYGTIGDVFFLDEPYWPLNTALYVVDFKGNDPRFAAYLLRNTLKNYRSEKAAVPGVDRSVLHLLKVRAPDRRLQERIVSILSAYDDLIENNRRRIALLGEATRIHYREWFVHFRFPGHEHIKIIGGIPDGWKRQPLAELTTKIGSGATPKGGESSYEEVGISLFRSQNIYDYYFEPAGLAFLNEQQARALSNVEVQPGDILLNITGASVGRCCAAPRRFLPARVNQHVMILRADALEVSPQYLLHSINSPERKKTLLNIARAGGATREALTKEAVSSLMILVPPKGLLEAFDSIVGPMHTQQELLAETNEKLASARDLLVPRLLSSEIVA